MQRIFADKSIQKSNSNFDFFANTFYKLIQEFFFEECLNYPCAYTIKNEDWEVYCIFGGSPKDENVNIAARKIVEVWIEKEEPIIFGKQLMIRSFFIRDLVDRKVVACIPSKNDGTWNLLFEGGVKLNLGSEMSYSKDIATFEELGFWSISSVQNILLEPVYAFGKIYYPRELYIDIVNITLHFFLKDVRPMRSIL